MNGSEATDGGAGSEAMPLDRLGAGEIVRRMNAEDARVAAAVAGEASQITAAVEAVAHALSSGGRLVYAGAGTSGRLAVLDAAECPPTFGVSSQEILAMIAGGDPALRESVEGAEDDTEQAVRDLTGLDPPLSRIDVVVGVAASGTTPYVGAVLGEARKRDATTVLVCCNPSCRGVADIVIAVDTGPEVVAGSTRLKAGTATKLVLNTITTAAMALTGRVYNGEMVCMRPINAKLRRRAVRMVCSLTGVDEDEAAMLLETADNRIPVAVVMARKRVGLQEARRSLAQADGDLRAVLEEECAG